MFSELNLWNDYANVGPATETITNSTDDLPNTVEDKISSAQSVRGTWTLFKDKGFSDKGGKMLICHGQKYPRLHANDAYSSAKFDTKECGMNVLYNIFIL